MKKLFLISLLCSIALIGESQVQQSDDHQLAKQQALQAIATISDSIAALIINTHHAKDPAVAQKCCTDLVVSLADILANAIITKIERSKDKQTRTALSDDFDAQVDRIARNLAEKIMHLDVI
jgi:hypothetical protein